MPFLLLENKFLVESSKRLFRVPSRYAKDSVTGTHLLCARETAAARVLCALYLSVLIQDWHIL